MQKQTTQKIPIQSKTKQLRPNLEIEVCTWVKDSHGLFDYQAQEQYYEVESYSANADCFIYCDHKGKLSVDSESKPRTLTTRSRSSINNSIARIGSLCIEQCSAQAKPGFKVNINKNFDNKVQNIHAERFGPFIVLNEYTKNNDNGYPLVPGNVIKLGRVEFLVLQLKNMEEVHSLRDTVHVSQTSGSLQVQKNRTSTSTNATLQCKICLCDQNQDNNPLISPCQCKGSCEFLHLYCLQRWINSKVKQELHGLVCSYNFTKFECEICKSPFPSSITNEGQKIDMMTIKKPQKPYIIIQTLHGKSEGKDQKCLHVICADENVPVKIGRGHTSQIKVSDISVSRQHAMIGFIDNQYYLKDQASKFGTLVSFDQDITLNTDMPSLKLQYGRSVMTIRLGQYQEPDQDTQ